MVSHLEIEFAGDILREHFGPQVERVGITLLTFGTINEGLSLSELIQYMMLTKTKYVEKTEKVQLSTEDTKACLCILMQHNIVEAVSKDTTENKKLSISTKYIAHIDHILWRVRFADYRRLVEGVLASNAAQMPVNADLLCCWSYILVNGKRSFRMLYECDRCFVDLQSEELQNSADEDTGEVQMSKIDAYKNVICELLRYRLIERVEPHVIKKAEEETKIMADEKKKPPSKKRKAEEDHNKLLEEQEQVLPSHKAAFNERDAYRVNLPFLNHLIGQEVFASHVENLLGADAAKVVRYLIDRSKLEPKKSYVDRVWWEMVQPFGVSTDAITDELLNGNQSYLDTIVNSFLENLDGMVEVCDAVQQDLNEQPVKKKARKKTKEELMEKEADKQAALVDDLFGSGATNNSSSSTAIVLSNALSKDISYQNKSLKIHWVKVRAFFRKQQSAKIIRSMFVGANIPEAERVFNFLNEDPLRFYDERMVEDVCLVDIRKARRILNQLAIDQFIVCQEIPKGSHSLQSAPANLGFQAKGVWLFGVDRGRSEHAMRNVLLQNIRNLWKRIGVEISESVFTYNRDLPKSGKTEAAMKMNTHFILLQRQYMLLRDF